MALATGELLSPALQPQRLSFVPTGQQVQAFTAFPGPTLAVGYGLGIGNFGGCLGHTGEINGYEGVMVFNPAAGTTIVSLQNATVAFGPPGQTDPTSRCRTSSSRRWWGCSASRGHRCPRRCHRPRSPVPPPPRTLRLT